MSSKIGSAQQEGICPGHNLLVWYEDTAGASAPVTLSSGVVVDTSVRRAGTSSARFNMGALIATCGYNGARVDWTFVTCSYTGNGSYPTVAVTLGNDGTVGQIWIDDLSLSIANP